MTQVRIGQDPRFFVGPSNVVLRPSSGAPFHFLFGGQHVASELPLLRQEQALNATTPTYKCQMVLVQKQGSPTFVCHFRLKTGYRPANFRAT